MTEARRRKMQAGRFAALAGDFWRNPERHKLSAAAQALYCASLSYSADQLTDGEVPSFMIPALAGNTVGNAAGNPEVTLDGIAKELTSLGWWSANVNGFNIVGWTKYNPTKAEVEAKAQIQKDRAAKRWADSDDAAADANGNAAGNAPPDPRPHLPDPISHPPANDARGRDPIPADSEPHRGGLRYDPRRARESLSAAVFRRLFESGTGHTWEGPKRGNGDPPDAIDRWAEAEGARHWCTAEQVLVCTIKRWSSDDWVQDKGFPWRSFALNFRESWRPEDLETHFPETRQKTAGASA